MASVPKSIRGAAVAYRLQLGMQYSEIATRLGVEPTSIARWVTLALFAAGIDREFLSTDRDCIRRVLVELKDKACTGRPSESPAGSALSLMARDDATNEMATLPPNQAVNKSIRKIKALGDLPPRSKKRCGGRRKCGTVRS